ncbi:MAG: MauE/DoxX family redox-associated membrane protein [Candidatus Cyclobacteriaceae bacterium M2_1C_046]
MKTQQNITLIITGILILVFAYTGISKFLDMETFRSQMLSQPIPAFIKIPLSWILPALEIFVAIFLISVRTRFKGYFFATALMTVFTGYTALMTLDAFSHTPCSCGGIISTLSWEQHLFLNAVLLLSAIYGLYLISSGTIPEDWQREMGTRSRIS